jgi:hypothetical protein
MDALRGRHGLTPAILFNKHEINEIRAGSCIKEAWVSLLPDEMPSEPVEEDGLNEPDEEDELIHGRKCFTCLNAPASTRLGCGHSCFCTNCLGKYVCSPIPDFICPFCRVKVSVGQCSMGVQVPFENAFVEPVNGGHIDDGADSSVQRRHRHAVAQLEQNRDAARGGRDLPRAYEINGAFRRREAPWEALVTARVERNQRRHQHEVAQLEQDVLRPRTGRWMLAPEIQALHEQAVAQLEQDRDAARRGRDAARVEVGVSRVERDAARVERDAARVEVGVSRVEIQALHEQAETSARVERFARHEVVRLEQDVDDARRGRELQHVEVGTLHEQAETGRLWQALAHTGRLW